eukprot:ctg_898.g387
MRTVRSSDADANHSGPAMLSLPPSSVCGAQAMSLMPCPCPVSTDTAAPSCTDHNRMVLSADDDANTRPSSTAIDKARRRPAVPDCRRCACVERARVHYRRSCTPQRSAHVHANSPQFTEHRRCTACNWRAGAVGAPLGIGRCGRARRSSNRARCRHGYLRRLHRRPTESPPRASVATGAAARTSPLPPVLVAVAALRPRPHERGSQAMRGRGTPVAGAAQGIEPK